MAGPTLWLVGMMGSGKTRIGQMVASAAGVPFFDTDHEIVSDLGIDVAEVFARDGEARFRQVEGGIIERLAGRTAVVGTGGGAVLSRANVDLMRSTGTVIWLDVAPGELARRVGDGASRPLLCGAESTEDRLSDILERRRGAYEEAAHHRVDGARDASEVAHDVEGLWNAS
jgi:shikimate kinase